MTTRASKFAYLVFLIAGWAVGDMLGRFLLPVLGPALSFICRPLGAIVGLLFARPVMGIKTKWGYLGATGAVLLAILVSCGAGSVGNLINLSQATIAAYGMERGEVGSVVAIGPARGCQIAINEFNLGLLSEEELREQCGDLSLVQGEAGEGLIPLRVPKPSFLLFVWELGKLILIGVIAVLVFGRGVMPWKKEVEPGA